MIDVSLPKVNKNEVRKQVAVAIDKYRMCLLMTPLEFQPKITATYSLIPPSRTNIKMAQTEDIAIKRIDFENEKKEYMEWFHSAINRLSPDLRVIIIKRYMEQDDVFDYQVYNEIGLSERSYYRKKYSALEKLALLLNLPVYEEKR